MENYLKGKGILVGIFNEAAIDNKADLRAVAQKKRETGFCHHGFKTDIGKIILDYAWKIYEDFGCYWYEDEYGDVYGAKLIARLQYSICHDIANADDMSSFFPDADVCGEHITENGIEYLWFAIE